MPVSDSDLKFISDLLDNELDLERLELLDDKLKDTDFKAAYEEALDAKYRNKKGLLRGYAPMIVLLILLVVGILLIIEKL